jgi:hypothetical protein
MIQVDFKKVLTKFDIVKVAYKRDKGNCKNQEITGSYNELLVFRLRIVVSFPPIFIIDNYNHHQLLNLTR